MTDQVKREQYSHHKETETDEKQSGDFFVIIIAVGVNGVWRRLFQFFPAVGRGGDQGYKRFRYSEGRHVHDNITPGHRGTGQSEQGWVMDVQGKDDHDHDLTERENIRAQGKCALFQDFQGKRRFRQERLEGTTGYVISFKCSPRGCNNNIALRAYSSFFFYAHPERRIYLKLSGPEGLNSTFAGLRS
jgi:hypothetical protein